MIKLNEFSYLYKITSILFLACLCAQIHAQESPLIMINNEFKIEWLAPNVNSKEVPKHHKLEFGLRLNPKIDEKVQEFISNQKAGLNPFNPEDINIEITFVSPSNTEQVAHGFYYQDYKRKEDGWINTKDEYNWRVRFAPNELGRWIFVLKIFIEGKEVASIGSKFKCVPSESKGRLKRNYKGDETDRYLYFSETKEGFFGIGHNIAHSAYYKLTPKDALRHQKWLTQLAENGGNFFRLELGAPNGLPDWVSYNNYADKMPQMWEFDQLVEHAQDLNLYFILFRHHTELDKGESWDVAKWDNNPYKIGFNLSQRKEYFTNREVLKWQKNTLRYIFSRWGYSTSFAFYEYQEIDLWLRELKHETGMSDEDAITFFTSWYLKQKAFIRDSLQYPQLFVNTYATTPNYELNEKSRGLFYHSDVIGFHKYGQDKDINYVSRYDKAQELFDTWNKPFFVEEMGLSAGGKSDYLPLYKCSPAPFHNAIWSTSFMGGAGTGLSWWWDRGIHDFGYCKHYNGIQLFFEGEQMEDAKFQPQKWHNTLGLNRAMLENYALVSKNQERVLGWVHNASHYWRNISSPCLNELINEGKFSEPFQLEDGIELGKKRSETSFSGKIDAYTNKGGTQNVSEETFVIKKLKAGGLFSKRKWYEITFYTTSDMKQVHQEKLKTTIWGKLKPTYPKTEQQDLCYKIRFIGEGKKP